MNAQNDLMTEIRASFFVECEELLEALQDGLQLIEDGSADDETINVVFRAVHSIKGGAGAFGLERLVHFTHGFESVLEQARSGRLTINASKLKLFFQAADHLADLVGSSRDDKDLAMDATTDLVGKLEGLLGEKDDAAYVQKIAFEPIAISVDLDDIDRFSHLSNSTGPPLAPNLTGYTITFVPLAELFETGNEPFILLKNLAELGHAKVEVDISGVPVLRSLAPDSIYISWKVHLTTTADAAEIASVFEFVEGLCRLTIVPDTADGNTFPLAEQDKGVRHPFQPAQPTEAENDDTDQSTSTTRHPKLDEELLSKPTKPSATATPSIVRVDLDRIERLVNLVGELVINQAMLSQSLEQSGLPPHCAAMIGLEEFQRLTRDIQDSVMMIRAQPVKSLFQRMSRIAREASDAVEKDVRLHTDGDATEVDKSVIERLTDPLTHMIRNAVDHGLETPQARVDAGKSPQGNVRLSAAHRSGRVIIEISDDGAGINRRRVRKTAIAKGLIPEDAKLSDTEIDNLLFTPGFSTASTPSELSGRGVGMDVVRTAIQALGGRITISSVEGQGTTFSMSLPLTLAVLDGMVIEVAGETLVLPLNLVIETLTLAPDDVKLVGPGNAVLLLRGALVPLFDLGIELGYRKSLTNLEDTVILLISHEDGGRAAMIVDNIIDQRQVVIKGLDESFHRAPGVAAATILGDGEIALILDPSDIIAHALHPPRHALCPPTRRSRVMNEKSKTANTELMIFHLADQEYALDIMSVREIRGWTRATPLPHAPPFMKGVINLRGTVLPVMDLAARLGLPPRENTARNVIIVVKLGDTLMGLLVDAVSDIIARGPEDLQAPPDMSIGNTNKVVKALTLIDDRMIRVLDLRAVIALAESAAA